MSVNYGKLLEQTARWLTALLPHCYLTDDVLLLFYIVLFCTKNDDHDDDELTAY